jgi:hypothetical protein
MGVSSTTFTASGNTGVTCSSGINASTARVAYGIFIHC